jgi:hypothetical protein
MPDAYVEHGVPPVDRAHYSLVMDAVPVDADRALRAVEMLMA